VSKGLNNINQLMSPINVDIKVSVKGSKQHKSANVTY
jgi:hypothetical protein